MSQNDDYDPWASETLTGSLAGDDLKLIFETTERIEPLDDQFGVHPPKTVPDALYDLFFGQPEPTEAEIAQYGSAEVVPAMQTYAILDAAKVVNLVAILETSGLEHRCLFKGDAYDELKDVAPWIVRLKEGDKFTRHLFTAGKAPWYLWDQEPGIFIRSRGTLDDMWRHFRKFTKIQDESGKWFYFRFWEPDIAHIHFDHISDVESTWVNWFYGNQSYYVSSCIILRKTGTVHAFSIPEILSRKIPQSFHLKAEEIEKFRYRRFEQSLDDISARLAKYAPERSALEVTELVNSVVQRFFSYGFRSKASFFVLAWCELQHGPMFERKLSRSVLKQISNNSRDEDLRISDIRAALEHGANVIS